MSQALLTNLISQVNTMGLNTENLPLSMTDQSGCWDNGPGPDKAEIFTTEQLKEATSISTIAKTALVVASPFVTLLV
jgi:hypothetical protein